LLLLEKNKKIFVTISEKTQIKVS